MQMMKRTHTLGSVLPLFAISLFVGCGTTQRGIVSDEPSPRKVIVLDHQTESNHERALQHFIEGVTFDAKERYADAILEYQEALQYEPNAAIYYALSRDYALLGKHLRASEAAREAVRMDSTKIAYRENLAAIYLSLFQQDLAIKEYETLVRLDSNYLLGWYNLARLHQQSRPLKALEIYEHLLDRNPEEWDILLQSAELCNSLGRFEKAAGYYRRMLELDPGNRPLQRQLAETYSKAGKIDEAVKLLEAMLEVDRNDYELTAILGEVYLERREYGKAASLFESLLKSQKTNPEIRLRVGVAYVGQVQRDSTFVPKAKEIFERLRTDLPNDFRVFWYLGIIALSEKQDSLAGEYFERVTSLEERNAEAWWFLGSNYFDRNDFPRLLQKMERARKLFPNDARFYMLTGLAYSRQGQSDAAVQMLETAYKLNPRDINTLSQLALTYDGLRKWQQSDSLYEEALRIDAKNPLILNNYSYSLSERRLQLDRALKMATQAVEAEPENASYLDTLGWVFFQIGRYVDAETYLAKAVATGHASAVVHEHLGDAYYKLGKKDKAIEWWNKALGMNSSNPSLKDKIERGSL